MTRIFTIKVISEDNGLVHMHIEGLERDLPDPHWLADVLHKFSLSILEQVDASPMVMH